MEAIKNENKYFYSYDFLQVKHLIRNGCNVINVGIGDKNGDLWFKFLRNDKIKQLTFEWNNK